MLIIGNALQKVLIPQNNNRDFTEDDCFGSTERCGEFLKLFMVTSFTVDLFFPTIYFHTKLFYFIKQNKQ